MAIRTSSDALDMRQDTVTPRSRASRRSTKHGLTWLSGARTRKINGGIAMAAAGSACVENGWNRLKHSFVTSVDGRDRGTRLTGFRIMTGTMSLAMFAGRRKRSSRKTVRAGSRKRRLLNDTWPVLLPTSSGSIGARLARALWRSGANNESERGPGQKPPCPDFSL